LLRCLLSHRPLVVLSLRRFLVVLHRLVVVSPLVAPPSRPLVVKPSYPLVILSLRRPLIVSSHQLIVTLPLIAPPSRRPLTPPLSRHLAPAGCCVTSRCAALSSSPPRRPMRITQGGSRCIKTGAARGRGGDRSLLGPGGDGRGR
jgi:hypothetical protein